jgi:hypothetical protein
MSDEELISLAREARENAHTAGRSSQIAFAASRRLQEFLTEIEHRGLDRQLVFGPPVNPLWNGEVRCASVV